MQQSEMHVNSQLASIHQKLETTRKENSEALKEMTRENKIALADIDTKLDTFIRDFNSLAEQGRGGWKALAWLVGAVGLIAVAADWTIEFLSKLGGGAGGV